MHHLVNMFNLQTRLFNNVTADISDEDAGKQPNGHTNHIAWLTGHIVSTRYMLANSIGLSEQEPFPDFFGNGKGRDDSASYPLMSDLVSGWNSLADKIAEKLGSMDEESLSTEMPRAVPTGNTLGDFISFLIHHEAYTIGQIGILRRYWNMEAMKYS